METFIHRFTAVPRATLSAMHYENAVKMRYTIRIYASERKREKEREKERDSLSENIALVTQFYRRIIFTVNPNGHDAMIFAERPSNELYLYIRYVRDNKLSLSPLNSGRIYCCGKTREGKKKESERPRRKRKLAISM